MLVMREIERVRVRVTNDDDAIGVTLVLSWCDGGGVVDAVLALLPTNRPPIV